MKHPPVDLLRRLDAIAESVAAYEQSMAVVGVGSVGTQQDRLDEYSDLDFFVVVQEGVKERFIDDLGWLARVHPIAFSFQNTIDGYKVLFEDGIYAEFAVFEPAEIAKIPAADLRVVWHCDSFDPEILKFRSPERSTATVEFLVGEALTNLYVGLCRLARGERLSAYRFIQGHALDCLLQLAPRVQKPVPSPEDGFDRTRRFELRFPDLARSLPDALQGYERSAESALAILSFLEGNFVVDPSIKAAILAAAADSA